MKLKDNENLKYIYKNLRSKVIIPVVVPRTKGTLECLTRMTGVGRMVPRLNNLLSHYHILSP